MTIKNIILEECSLEGSEGVMLNEVFNILQNKSGARIDERLKVSYERILFQFDCCICIIFLSNVTNSVQNALWLRLKNISELSFYIIDPLVQVIHDLTFSLT